MTKYSELSDSGREFQRDWVSKRWDQLNELRTTATNQIVSYLFLTNAGGVVALLGYMGDDESARASLASQIALISFALGVVFVGVLRVLSFHQLDWMTESWGTDAQKYFRDELLEEDMDNTDDRRANGWLKRAQMITGYGAFGCFLIGVIVGGTKFLA